jgi:enoyl-CoA hydratase/carnithine racemase
MDMSSIREAAAGGVTTITLARPEIRNALTGKEMLEELIAAIDRADRDPAVGVLVVTGEGPAFSAGGNVKEMAERTGMFAGDPDTLAERYRRTIQQLTRRMLEVDLATIAAVNGPAIGAGFDLALACDLRIGSTAARFAHTFVDLGIIPGDGGAWLLPRIVGFQRAAELSFTARVVEAEEAERMGILLEVVAPERLPARAAEIAARIASKPAHSVRMAKRLLRHSREMSLEGFLDLSAAFQSIAHHTPEHRQAVATYWQRLQKGN